MIPLGLILNEIISNSLKYAFKKNTGEISISLLHSKQKNKYTIIVADNGAGLPKGFNRKKDSSLGMQLIFMLAEQLNGKVSLESKKGTSYTIEF